jgi:glucose-1-phosphate thymidylyltransferase
MKVIIPAAGFGSRLRPHTYTTPKVLLPVAGKPILEHIINQVISFGADHITIIHGHLGEQIEEFVKDRFDVTIDLRLQEKPLGLGHAIYLGLDDDDQEILVILGDTILDLELNEVVRKGVTALGVKEVADPRKFGVVVVEDGRVSRLVEKPLVPPSNLAIVGAYYIRDARVLGKAIKEIINKNITVKGEFQITDALQLMLQAGEKFETFPVSGWYDCGKPETLLATNKFLLGKSRTEPVINDDIKDSIIIPPVYIGEKTTITRSVIGPNVSIGDGCQISDVIMENSIIGDRASVQNIVIRDAIIGKRTELAGGRQSVSLGASTMLKL